MIRVQPITLRRYPAQTVTGGRQVLGAPTDTTIRATVYPATGRDLEALPEGERQRDVVIAQCLAEVRVSDPRDSTTSDRLIIRNVTYLAYNVQNWPRVGNVPEHWRTVCVRLQETE